MFSTPESVMRRAIELASRGVGFVEPNPPVGAVVVDDRLNLLGEGFHERFGGPHAEVHALRQTGEQAAGATLFVTLEPCCHVGKTGPCTRAILDAGIRRVVVATGDPAPHAAGRGIAELRAAGVDVELGLLETEARRLAAPFIKRVTTGLPWVHAKWAMTLDGKIATRTGHSRWISGAASREVVHRLRGRMDAIIVGAQTAAIDDPLLTARPPGPRTATRIVIDGAARLPVDSQLVRTIDRAPLLVATVEGVAEANANRLRESGAEVLELPPSESKKVESKKVSGTSCAEHPAGRSGKRLLTPFSTLSSTSCRPDLSALLRELGRRAMTNVLVEGGGRLLGSFFDQGLIDEVHVFVAPKLVGGKDAITPLAGTGLAEVPELPQIEAPQIELLGPDVYIHGPL